MLRRRMIADCFLCHPDQRLVFAETHAYLAMCGLGPILPGYSLVASKAHIPSMADLDSAGRAALSGFLERVGSLVTTEYGPPAIAEHGRVPICDFLTDNADGHCYHAHLLLFPAAPPMVAEALKQTERWGHAESLSSALELAATKEHYLLIGDRDAPGFDVLAPPDPPVRQFARTLVAAATGRPELADWRKFPDHASAVEYAAALRARALPSEA
jgi:hypothetical protein